MKKITYILMLITILVSCKDDDKGLLDPHTPVAISGIQTRVSDDTVTLILKHVLYMHWTNSDGVCLEVSLGMGESYLYENGITRDFENKRILFSGNYIIATGDNGWHRPGYFLSDAKDVVFCQGVADGNIVEPETSSWDSISKAGVFIRDTIAYIPNNVLKSAQEAIQAAYYAEDFETVYKLFESSMVFLPTTGAKWRAMKAAGIE